MCYTAKQYDNRIKKLQELEAQKRELEKKIAELQDDIKTDMGETEHIETELFKINWTKIAGSRFDSKALKAADSTLYARYLVPTETRRFSYATI